MLVTLTGRQLKAPKWSRPLRPPLSSKMEHLGQRMRCSVSMQEAYDYFGKRNKSLGLQTLLNTLFSLERQKYVFLTRPQIWGRVYKSLQIPNVCGDIDKKRLRKLAICEKAKAKNKLNIQRTKVRQTKEITNKRIEEPKDVRLNALPKEKINGRLSSSEKSNSPFQDDGGRAVTFMEERVEMQTQLEKNIKESSSGANNFSFNTETSVEGEDAKERGSNQVTEKNRKGILRSSKERNLSFQCDTVRAVTFNRFITVHNLEESPPAPSMQVVRSSVEKEEREEERKQEEEKELCNTSFSPDSSLDSSLEESPLKRSVKRIICTITMPKPNLNLSEDSFSDDNGADTGVFSEEEVESQEVLNTPPLGITPYFNCRNLKSFRDFFQSNLTVEINTFGGTWRELVKPVRRTVNLFPEASASYNLPFSNELLDSINEINYKLALFSFSSKMKEETDWSDDEKWKRKIEEMQSLFKIKEEISDTDNSMDAFDVTLKARPFKTEDTTILFAQNVENRTVKQEGFEGPMEENIIHRLPETSPSSAVGREGLLKEVSREDSPRIYISPKVIILNKSSPTKSPSKSPTVMVKHKENLPTRTSPFLSSTKKTPQSSVIPLDLSKLSTVPTKDPNEQFMTTLTFQDTKKHKVVRKIDFGEDEPLQRSFKDTSVLEKGFHQRYVDQKYRLSPSSSESESFDEDMPASSAKAPLLSKVWSPQTDKRISPGEMAKVVSPEFFNSPRQERTISGRSENMSVTKDVPSNVSKLPETIQEKTPSKNEGRRVVQHVSHNLSKVDEKLKEITPTKYKTAKVTNEFSRGTKSSEQTPSKYEGRRVEQHISPKLSQVAEKLKEITPTKYKAVKITRESPRHMKLSERVIERTPTKYGGRRVEQHISPKLSKVTEKLKDITLTKDNVRRVKDSTMLLKSHERIKEKTPTKYEERRVQYVSPKLLKAAEKLKEVTPTKHEARRLKDSTNLLKSHEGVKEQTPKKYEERRVQYISPKLSEAAERLKEVTPTKHETGRLKDSTNLLKSHERVKEKSPITHQPGRVLKRSEQVKLKDGLLKKMIERKFAQSTPVKKSPNVRKEELRNILQIMKKDAVSKLSPQRFYRHHKSDSPEQIISHGSTEKSVYSSHGSTEKSFYSSHGSTEKSVYEPRKAAFISSQLSLGHSPLNVKRSLQHHRPERTPDNLSPKEGLKEKDEHQIINALRKKKHEHYKGKLQRSIENPINTSLLSNESNTSKSSLLISRTTDEIKKPRFSVVRDIINRSEIKGCDSLNSSDSFISSQCSSLQSSPIVRKIKRIFIPDKENINANTAGKLQKRKSCVVGANYSVIENSPITQKGLQITPPKKESCGTSQKVQLTPSVTMQLKSAQQRSGQKRKALGDITPLKKDDNREESSDDSQETWSPARKSVCKKTPDNSSKKAATPDRAGSHKRKSAVAFWKNNLMESDSSLDESLLLNRRLYYMGSNFKKQT